MVGNILSTKNMTTRQQKAAAKKKAEIHYTYIKDYRGEIGSDYRQHENKQRILRRVAKGAVPQVTSMERNDITLEDINDVRKINALEPIVMNIPMFLQSRRYRDRVESREAEADFVPDVSEVRDDYVPQDDEEIEQPVPMAEAQQQQRRQYTGALDAMAVSIWMRNNPRQASAKRTGAVSQASTDNQFGMPNSNKTGYFYNFMKYLGDDYVKNIGLVLRGGADEYIRDKINAPRKNIRGGGFKTLRSTNNEFSTVFAVLREYPKFSDDYKNDQRFKDAYDRLDRVFTETEAKISADKLQNPKEEKPVVDWNSIKKLVKQKYKNALSKENLYIDLYEFVPSRDDWANLFVDASDNAYPDVKNKAQMDSIIKNTLFLPNNNTRKKYPALFVLVNYKTKGLYGTQSFTLSNALTDRVVKYWEKEGKPTWLFGRPKMSSWVGSLLDSIGITDRDKSNISYLRRSYISTQMKSVKTAKEREDLSIKLRHSPSASLKYIREVLPDVKDLDVGAVKKTLEKRFQKNLDAD